LLVTCVSNNMLDGGSRFAIKFIAVDS